MNNHTHIHNHTPSTHPPHTIHQYCANELVFFGYESVRVRKCTGMKKTGYENERVWNVRIPIHAPQKFTNNNKVHHTNSHNLELVISQICADLYHQIRTSSRRENERFFINAQIQDPKLVLFFRYQQSLKLKFLFSLWTQVFHNTPLFKNANSHSSKLLETISKSMQYAKNYL